MNRGMQQQSRNIFVDEILSTGGRAIAQKFDLGIADNILEPFEICEKNLGLVAESSI